MNERTHRLDFVRTGFSKNRVIRTNALALIKILYSCFDIRAKFYTKNS